MTKRLIKAIGIILGSMALMGIIIIGILRLIVQEMPTIPLEEYPNYPALRHNINLDPATPFEITFPLYFPEYFLNPNYPETENHILESSTIKHYANVELYDAKTGRFTHQGYTIVFWNRVNHKPTLIESTDEKFVIASIFDRKPNESIFDRHIDDGGVVTVFFDNAIVDVEETGSITIDGNEIRYFLKDGGGSSDKTQLTAFFKRDNAVFKIYIEVSRTLSGHGVDWCFAELEAIVQGLA